MVIAPRVSPMPLCGPDVTRDDARKNMGDRAGPILGSFVWFWIAPGTVAGWVPYALSEWRIQPPLLGVPGGRVVGAVVAAMGVMILVECFSRFAIKGRGTPAPIAPTETLVVSGLYRHVRNPMYVAVLAIIVGQALLFGSVAVLGYAGVVWLLFHGFVLAYEEPTLRRKFGSSYDAYRANVRRWWPRIRPWRGSSSD
jgi:protein-S-isoprenylcysteine O-methyltransferase Ste14